MQISVSLQDQGQNDTPWEHNSSHITLYLCVYVNSLISFVTPGGTYYVSQVKFNQPLQKNPWGFISNCDVPTFPTFPISLPHSPDEFPSLQQTNTIIESHVTAMFGLKSFRAYDCKLSCTCPKWNLSWFPSLHFQGGALCFYGEQTGGLPDRFGIFLITLLSSISVRRIFQKVCLWKPNSSFRDMFLSTLPQWYILCSP